MVTQRGGFREGAGRKANYDEPTKVIRVPESRVIEIKNYLVKSKEARFNDIASITLVDHLSRCTFLWLQKRLLLASLLLLKTM